MTHPLSTLERAYELARTGKLPNMTDIIRQLKAEGYDSVEAHLAGRGIRTELTKLVKASRAR